MYISKLRVSNFKSFYDKTEIDFEQYKGLWRVSGQIGSGKTTIGEAIIYGLYGTISGKKNSDLISWGQKHGLVELWCMSYNKHLYIKRELNAYGQSPMYVEVDGEPIVFTNKRNAQAQLEQDFLDTPRTTMELLCIISFNNFKSLSTLNTKDTKLFLDQVLGFETLTTYINACKEEQSSLRTTLITAQANAKAISTQIDRMEHYVPPEGDPSSIKSTLSDLKKRQADIENEYKNKLSQPTHDILECRNRLAEVRALGSAKKREIDFIKKGTCPTCGANIDQSQLSLKEAERENLVKQYKEITARISDLEAHISSLTEEMTKYIAEAKNRVKSTENTLIRVTEQMRQTKATKSEISKLKKELAEYEQEQLKIQQDLKDYEQLIQILQVQIRSKILDSFIPSINSKIRELAGMLNLSYVPEYDSTFKCTIHSSGLESISTSSLSTGQLKLVDMVIILAIVGSIISKVQSNIIFLDELFSNLDPRTRTELIGVLRIVLPQNSTVLIVSHQEVDHEMFDGTIKLKLVPGEDKFQKTEINIERN